MSACKKHTDENKGHEMSYDKVEVIDQASSSQKLAVKELLHILKLKPELNRQLNSQSSFDIKTIIVQAYPQHRTK